MRKFNLILVVAAGLILVTGTAFAAEKPTVKEAVKNMYDALKSDTSLDPKVKDALHGLCEALENEGVGPAVGPDNETAVRRSVEDWFAADSESYAEYFGQKNEKGFWDRWKLYGDFRIRYEVDAHRDERWRDLNSHSCRDSHRDDRASYQARFRIGFQYDVGHHMYAGARLSTGPCGLAKDEDQIFTGDFTRIGIGLDRVYVRWSPFEDEPYHFEPFGTDCTVDFYAGKFDHRWAFYATPMVWDEEAQPTGFAVREKVTGLPLFDAIELAFGMYVLTEEDENDDAWVNVGQLTLHKEVMDNLKMRISAAFYDWNDVDNTCNDSSIDGWDLGGAIDDEGRTHPYDWRGGYEFLSDFEILDFIVQLEYTGLEFLNRQWPVIATFNYAYNTDARENDETADAWMPAARNRGEQNDAIMFDLWVGKIEKQGDWAFNYGYWYVEQDAVFALVTQDDFPFTNNFKGHTVGARYMLFDKVWLESRIFFAKQLVDDDFYIDETAQTSDRTNVRFRVDLNIDF